MEVVVLTASSILGSRQEPESHERMSEDEESGSAYHSSSEDCQESADEQVTSRGRRRERSARSSSGDEDGNFVDPQTTSKYDDPDWIRQQAIAFAAAFQPPESADAIPDVQREGRSVRERSKSVNPTKRATGTAGRMFLLERSGAC